MDKLADLCRKLVDFVAGCALDHPGRCRDAAAVFDPAGHAYLPALRCVDAQEADFLAVN